MNIKEKSNSTIRRTDRAGDSNKDLAKMLKTVRAPISGEGPISRVIDPMVKEGELYEQLEDNRVICYACGHRCKIKSGLRGVCQVRFNAGGKLYVPWGYVASLQSDPTEKKPFYHLLPGSDTLTFGMLGCDLHCSYCQNWDTSQALRNANAGHLPREISPEQLVALARGSGASCVASSYNEPLITSEWAVAVFKKARAAGFKTMYISNGNATREVLEYIRPFTDGYKIDLKSMNDKRYRKLGTKLERVLSGIQMVHKMGFWTEIVTLVVPGFNDSKEELREAARFIKSVSPDIPWHITAFHPDYKMNERDFTNNRTLTQAAELGYQEGLHYVYVGNIPGRAGNFENTYCPACQALLIERIGYVVLGYYLTDVGRCPTCGENIPGIWPQSEQKVRTGRQADLFNRMPRMVR